MPTMDLFSNVISAVGGGAAGGFFVWLSRRESVRLAAKTTNDRELQEYRKELKADLDKLREEKQRLYDQKAALLESNLLDRVRLEERITSLEREKTTLMARVMELEQEVRELTAEVAQLRSNQRQKIEP